MRITADRGGSHAELESQPDGADSVRDLGSTNGTTLGEHDDPLRIEALRWPTAAMIHVGAGTAITICRRH